MSASIGITQKYDLRDTNFSISQESILTVTKKGSNGQEAKLIVDFEQLSVANKVSVLELRLQNCWEEQQENIKAVHQIKQLDQKIWEELDEVTALVQDFQRMTGSKVMEPLPRAASVKENIESFEMQHKVNEQSRRKIAFVDPTEGKSSLPKISEHREKRK